MQENAVVIASKEREAVLYLAEDAPRAVRIACTNFLTDLNKICGCPARMTHDAREANVLVGVIGEDAAEDACAVGVDGRMQPRAAQYGGGAFFTYSSQFLWVWTLLSEMEIPAGEHVFSVAAVRSGLRIDRIYLTKGRELPPDDGHFSASKRTP